MTSKNEFTLGILGGMGPLAGIELQRKIVEKSPARNDNDHIKMVCFTNPHIHDRTKSLQEGKDFSGEIINSFNLMKSLRVNIGLMACNTAHAEFEKISSQVKFPLLNIVNETISFVESEFVGVKKIGLLATDGTIQSGVYAKAASERDFEIILPKKDDQLKIMEVIYGNNGVKAGNVGRKNAVIIKKIIASVLAGGAEVVILGCTELSLLKINGKKIIDPLDVISEKVVKMVLR